MGERKVSLFRSDALECALQRALGPFPVSSNMVQVTQKGRFTRLRPIAPPRVRGTGQRATEAGRVQLRKLIILNLHGMLPFMFWSERPGGVRPAFMLCSDLA